MLEYDKMTIVFYFYQLMSIFLAQCIKKIFAQLDRFSRNIINKQLVLYYGNDIFILATEVWKSFESKSLLSINLAISDLQ